MHDARDAEGTRLLAAGEFNALIEGEKLSAERDTAGSATGEAARGLVDAGLGVRDAAYLLGLSHQRVQQLLRSA